MTVTDVELAVGASGLLQTFNEAGVLDVADVRVAERICFLGKETDERVALAVALLVRGLRGGSVCVELATIASVCRYRGGAVALAGGVAGRGARQPAAQ